MSTLYVVEFSIFTDHDYGYNRDLFRNHTSRYFENDLYEYTVDGDGYGDEYRRVFDTPEKAYDFLDKLRESIHSTRVYIADEIRSRILEVMTGIFEHAYSEISLGYCNCDGHIVIHKEETEARPIKHIIYEGDDYELDE